MTPSVRATLAGLRCREQAETLAAAGLHAEAQTARANAAAWHAEGERLRAPRGRCWCGRRIPADAPVGEVLCPEHDDAPLAVAR